MRFSRERYVAVTPDSRHTIRSRSVETGGGVIAIRFVGAHNNGRQSNVKIIRKTQAISRLTPKTR